MLVDCQTCPVRDVRCADCMVTALSALPIVTGSHPSTTTYAVRPPARRSGTTPHGARSAAAPEAQRGVGEAPPPVATAPLDRAERRAVSVLLAAGLLTARTANAASAVLDAEPAVTQPRGRVRHAG